MSRFAGIAAVATVALMFSTAPADADPASANNAFITSLDVQGIPYTSYNAAVTAGKAVCASFDQGFSFAAVTLSARRAGSRLTSMDQADGFVRAATVAYCPQYAANPTISPDQWGMDDGASIGPRVTGTSCLAAESHKWADPSDGGRRALWCPPPAFVWVPV